MALRRAPYRLECLYWRGAVLGDLGRHREALKSIEAALAVLDGAEHWLLEDLYYEKVILLDALGLHDAAVAACEAGLDRCPGSALLRAALVADRTDAREIVPQGLARRRRLIWSPPEPLEEGTMMKNVSIGLAVALSLAGCSKKKATENKEPAAPMVQETGSAGSAAPAEAPLAGKDLADKYTKCVGMINDGKLDDFATTCVATDYKGHDMGGEDLSGADAIKKSSPACGRRSPTSR